MARMNPGIIFCIIVVACVILFVLLFNYLDGKFDSKTKWYQITDKVFWKYSGVQGINSCTKCGNDDCKLFINLDLPRIGVHKKVAGFEDHLQPKFYIECSKCGTRSTEDYDLKYVIKMWNMDSRFQIEENNKE